MRPIHKGNSPYESISHYQDAWSYLKEAIGEYCCYCEMPIYHVPEEDHIVSKSKGGDLTAWENLLFSCKYCNTRKKDLVDPDNVDQYLWPDRFNTGLAFSYANARPAVNIDILNKLDPSGKTAEMAIKIFELVKLGEIPDGSGKKKHKQYKRFWRREEARNCAKDCLSLIEKQEGMGKSLFEKTKKVIVDLALSTGFFSIWMTVFQDYPDILIEFINAFPGTEKRYYGEDGKSKPVRTV